MFDELLDLPYIGIKSDVSSKYPNSHSIVNVSRHDVRRSVHHSTIHKENSNKICFV